MAKIISIFNHKGGVSKTTSSFNLGWMLTKKGKKVLLVDTDPQCNLTNIVLGEDKFEKFYVNFPNRNLKVALSPAFEAKPALLEAFDCISVKRKNDLFLIPGSFELSEYEVSLGVSFTLSDTMITLKNLPGSFAYLIQKTSEKYNIDYVIIDMNPSLSAINQALLVSSDFFIVPTSPDNFSTMAVRSLSRILPKWEQWAIKARKIFGDANYPLPNVKPKFLGTVVQGYNIRKGKPTKANQEVIRNLNNTVETIFAASMAKEGMLLSAKSYSSREYCLANIPNFQSLNAVYQTNGVPVFALSNKQMGKVGRVLQEYQRMRKNFYDIFSSFADNIIRMTENA